MAAIMISIQPQWVEKILNKIKKNEIRKTCPKEWKDYLNGKTKVKPEPMKCVIYCTKNKPYLIDCRKFEHLPYNYDLIDYYCAKYDENAINGKVVACFTLNEVTKHLHNFIDAEDEECYNFLTEDVKNAGFKTDLDGLLDFDRFIEDYGKRKPLYAWHIDDLQVYDKPKELSEFIKYWDCKSCEDYNSFDSGAIYPDCINGRKLTRPPQSWCYVEEVG